MEVEEIKRYSGKKCLIILRNDFRYTGIIPHFVGRTFSIIDKYGSSVTIDCGVISLITELNGGNNK